jgi:CBS domain-containing membrane protein
MNASLRRWLPARPSVDRTEGLRACAGALIGILVTGLLSLHVVGSDASAVWLMAPMGASAVLLFAVPASPLAQPWSIVGGNIIAALVGVTCARVIDDPAAAAAVAVFVAIGAMLALRCLHPPSGAVALMAVLGGDAVHAAGYAFVLVPVALNSVLILIVALVYNNLTGRHYPHGQLAERHRSPHGTKDILPTSRSGFTSGDLQAVLEHYNQVIDVSVDDLEALFRQTEAHIYRRRFGEVRCRHIMSRDVMSVEFATELGEAWALMREHALQALPVIDRAHHVIGIVTRTDFLQHADRLEERTLKSRLTNFLRRTEGMHSDKHEVVGQIMTKPVRTALDSKPIVELVPLMSDIGLHHVPIVDSQARLVGMITQTDLIAALYETMLTRPNAEITAMPA